MRVSAQFINNVGIKLSIGISDDDNISTVLTLEDARHLSAELGRAIVAAGVLTWQNSNKFNNQNTKQQANFFDGKRPVCDRKRCYTSEDEAMRAHRRANWRIRVYWCAECTAYHVTNDDKSGSKFTKNAVRSSKRPKIDIDGD